MTIRVSSEKAEASISLLNQTLAHHHLLMSALHLTRRNSRLVSSLDREQVQCHSTLVRLLTITEAFVVDLLTRHVEPWAAGSEQAVRDHWSDNIDKETNTWAGIRISYGRWVGSASKTLQWDHPLGYAEARNAVAHGLGKLTRRQSNTARRRAVTLGALAKVEIIPTADDRIEVDDAGLSKAVKRLSEFIVSIDSVVEAAR